MGTYDEAEQCCMLGAAAGEAGLPVRAVVFIDHERPQRSCLIVDRIEIEALRRLARSGTRLGRRGLAAPWLLTPQVLASSRDTFPLELLELACAGRVLSGELELDPDTLDPAHVRLQVERELKSAAIQLRQELLSSAGKQRWLDESLAQTRIALRRVARGIVWARDRAAASDPEAWAAILPAGALRRLVDLLADERSGWETYCQLYAAVVAAAEAVDVDG